MSGGVNPRARRGATVIAAVLCIAAAQAIVLLWGSRGSGLVVIAAIVAVVLALIEPLVDEVTMLPWVTGVASVGPVIASLSDERALWSVAGAGVFVWAGTELLAVARAMVRLDQSVTLHVHDRVEVLALVGAVGVGATLVVGVVASSNAGGGLVLVGLAVVAVGAYRALARRYTGRFGSL